MTTTRRGQVVKEGETLCYTARFPADTDERLRRGETVMAEIIDQQVVRPSFPLNGFASGTNQLAPVLPQTVEENVRNISWAEGDETFSKPPRDGLVKFWRDEFGTWAKFNMDEDDRHIVIPVANIVRVTYSKLARIEP